MHLFVVELVDRIRVVPEDPEVGRGGMHGGEGFHHGVGVGDALRVGELRHAPDALHGWIGACQVVHRVHVRAVGVHMDRHHFDPQRAAHREVAVISGGRADELDAALTAPRFVASGDAEEHGADKGVVNDVEGRVAQYEDPACGKAEQLGEQPFRFRQAVQDPVVPAVHAAFAEAVAAVRNDGEHFRRQVKLLLVGLAARQVQREIFIRPAVELFLLGGADRQQLVGIHFGEEFLFGVHGIYLRWQMNGGRGPRHEQTQNGLPSGSSRTM